MHVDENAPCPRKRSSALSDLENKRQECCENKYFAIARPQYGNGTGEFTCDGKVGMWPFLEEKPAQGRIVNRERGERL